MRETGDGRREIGEGKKEKGEGEGCHSEARSDEESRSRLRSGMPRSARNDSLLRSPFSRLPPLTPDKKCSAPACRDTASRRPPPATWPGVHTTRQPAACPAPVRGSRSTRR